MKNTLCIVVLFLSLVGCAPTGVELERAMDDCEDVIDFENLKQRCLFDQNCINKISARQRETYFRQHPELSEDMKKSILNRQLRVGMDIDQVVLCWGNPWDVNKSAGRWGRYDQWVYYDGVKWRYLYFENGVLDSWQE